MITSIPTELSNNSVQMSINDQCIDKDDTACIICFGEENTINNQLCDCNFIYHTDCYVDWLTKSKEPLCIICSCTIDRDSLGINLRIIDESIEEVVSDDISLKRRLFQIVQNSTIPLETLNPIDLLLNIQSMLDIELPSIITTYKWSLVDRDYNIKKISLTYIPERALIYYSYINSTFSSNLQLSPSSQSRIIRFLTSDDENQEREPQIWKLFFCHFISVLLGLTIMSLIIYYISS